MQRCLPLCSTELGRCNAVHLVFQCQRDVVDSPAQPKPPRSLHHARTLFQCSREVQCQRSRRRVVAPWPCRAVCPLPRSVIIRKCITHQAFTARTSKTLSSWRASQTDGLPLGVSLHDCALCSAHLGLVTSGDANDALVDAVVDGEVRWEHEDGVPWCQPAGIHADQTLIA